MWQRWEESPTKGHTKAASLDHIDCSCFCLVLLNSIKRIIKLLKLTGEHPGVDSGAEARL